MSDTMNSFTFMKAPHILWSTSIAYLVLRVIQELVVVVHKSKKYTNLLDILWPWCMDICINFLLCFVSVGYFRLEKLALFPVFS